MKRIASKTKNERMELRCTDDTFVVSFNDSNTYLDLVDVWDFLVEAMQESKSLTAAMQRRQYEARAIPAATKAFLFLDDLAEYRGE